MEILFQDESLVVCVKPAGVLSQAADGKANMVALLQAELGGEIYPVHRLDKPVGGVMVFARTRAAAAHLSQQAASHTLEKTYLARVHGVPTPAAGELEDLLFKDSAKNKVFVVKRPRKGVKAAKLAYETLATDGATSLVKIRLFTGRTHQIRVQFASRKWPLLGDAKYGARDGETQLFLWSHALAFTHPQTGAALRFELPPLCAGHLNGCNF